MNAFEQKNNIITYERKIRVMSDNGQVSGDKPNKPNLKEIFNTVKEVLGVLVVVGGVAFYIISTLTAHGKDIENLKSEVSDMKENLEDIKGQINELTSLVKQDHEIFLDMASAKTSESAYIVKMKDIYEVKTESVHNEEYLVAPLWDENTVIASDISGDIVYKAEDLYNTPIITSYFEDGKEVYFYGRFNENNHWNGKCLLNVYSGDNLISIFEGMYDDGSLFSYKRVYGENSDKWTINDRVDQGKYNSGETWVYSKTEEFIKDFTIENVKEKQIITVDNFIASREEKLLSYYKGNTANGLYNDNTGDAYLVKYKEDGDVSILYKGRFKDGDFQDTTGEAWFVSWGDQNDGYYHYKGKFNNGKHGKAPTPWKPMTQEQINDVVNPERFNCPLTGLFDVII